MYDDSDAISLRVQRLDPDALMRRGFFSPGLEFLKPLYIEYN